MGDRGRQREAFHPRGSHQPDEPPVKKVQRQKEEGDEGDEGHQEDELAHTDVPEAVRQDEGGGLVGDEDEAGPNGYGKRSGHGRQADAGCEVEEDGGEDARDDRGVREEVEGEDHTGDGAQLDEDAAFRQVEPAGEGPGELRAEAPAPEGLPPRQPCRQLR